MAKPYVEGKVEGGSFCLQWLATILNISICLWSSNTKQIEKVYNSNINTNNTYNIISFKTSSQHTHYEPIVTTNLIERFQKKVQLLHI